LLNTYRKTWNSKDCLACSPVRRVLRNLPIAVHILNPETVERVQKVLAHDNERRIAYPRMVRDETNYALFGLFSDAAFGYAEEAHVQIIKIELLDAPLLN